MTETEGEKRQMAFRHGCPWVRCTGENVFPTLRCPKMIEKDDSLVTEFKPI